MTITNPSVLILMSFINLLALNIQCGGPRYRHVFSHYNDFNLILYHTSTLKQANQFYVQFLFPIWSASDPGHIYIWNRIPCNEDDLRFSP